MAKVVKGARNAVFALSMYVFWIGVLGMGGLVGITLLRHNPLSTLVAQSGSPQPASSIREAFSALLILTIAAVTVWFAVSILPLLLLPFLTGFLFLSMSAQGARRAEQAKRVGIQTPDAIATVTRSLRLESRRIFSPRLIVLDVTSDLWQATVRHLALDASLVLIDVSDPTENLIWELRQVAGFECACVFVGEYQHLRHLSTTGPHPSQPGDLRSQLAALLDGRSVLAYTTDPPGLRRFARSIRTALDGAPRRSWRARRAARASAYMADRALRAQRAATHTTRRGRRV